MAIVIKNKTLQDIKDLAMSHKTIEKKVYVEKHIPQEILETDIVVVNTTQEQKTLNRRFVVHRKELKGVASAENSLLVNGKQKHIGRKSHYLLDMLTLDDE